MYHSVFRVIETQVEIWETRNAVRTRAAGECFHSFFEFPRRTCFLFLLENTATKKKKKNNQSVRIISYDSFLNVPTSHPCTVVIFNICSLYKHFLQSKIIIPIEWHWQKSYVAGPIKMLRQVYTRWTVLSQWRQVFFLTV